MPETPPKLPYDRARRYVRTLGLRNRDEWRRYVRQHADQLDAKGIPHAPDIFYLSSAEKVRRVILRDLPQKERRQPRSWVGWKDWLGAAAPHPRQRFMPRTQFEQWLRQTKITSKATYERWRRENPTHCDLSRLPSTPAQAYIGFSWKTALGKPSHSKGAPPQQYAPFYELRRAVRALARQEGLTKESAFTAYVTAHPEWLQQHGCPKRPDVARAYDDYWRGWHDFLGINTKPTMRFKRL